MNPKNRFDAIVIGAGPAGSTTAYLLSSNGFRVLIVDKNVFPRSKLCGGLLTWKTVDLLERIFDTSVDRLKRENVITYQSSAYEVNCLTGASIKGRLEYPFHFVERHTYDFFWLKKAQAAGAEFRSEEKVIALDIPGKRVKTNSGSVYHGKFIIGADGIFSKIRLALGKMGHVKNRWKSGIALALEVSIPRDTALEFANEPVVYFGHIPWGYAWCFPKEYTWVIGMCGLVTKAGKHLRAAFNHLLESLGISKDEIKPPKACALPYGNYLTPPGYGNILLVGDACGLADPLLGEGIYYAHKSAQLAARAAMQSYRHPAAALQRYSDSLIPGVITELKFAKKGRQLIFSLPGSWPGRVLSSLLRTMPQKCEETIQGQRSFKWLRPRRREYFSSDNI